MKKTNLENQKDCQQEEINRNDGHRIHEQRLSSKFFNQRDGYDGCQHVYYAGQQDSILNLFVFDSRVLEDALGVEENLRKRR